MKRSHRIAFLAAAGLTGYVAGRFLMESNLGGITTHTIGLLAIDLAVLLFLVAAVGTFQGDVQEGRAKPVGHEPSRE